MNGLWIEWLGLLAQTRHREPVDDDNGAVWRKLLPLLVLGGMYLLNAIASAVKKKTQGKEPPPSRPQAEPVRTPAAERLPVYARPTPPRPPAPVARPKLPTIAAPSGRTKSQAASRTVRAAVAPAVSITRKPSATVPQTAPKVAVAQPMTAVHESTSSMQRLHLRLNDREDWARAVVLSEILSPPLAMRSDVLKRFSE